MTETLELTALTALLRRRFFRHNVQVLTLALLSLAAAAVLWAVAYVLAAWVTLFAVTMVATSEGREAAMPASFNQLFALGCGLLLLLAWLRRWSTPNGLPPDRKTVADHAADFVLLAPAITLAIWGNLSAWLWLIPWEARQAARLVVAISEKREFPLASSPVVIPDDGVRENVVLALLLTGVVELRHDDERAFLRLTGGAERELLGPDSPALRLDEA